MPLVFAIVPRRCRNVFVVFGALSNAIVVQRSCRKRGAPSRKGLLGVDGRMRFQAAQLPKLGIRGCRAPSGRDWRRNSALLGRALAARESEFYFSEDPER
jgi:hypothetical protein